MNKITFLKIKRMFWGFCAWLSPRYQDRYDAAIYDWMGAVLTRRLFVLPDLMWDIHAPYKKKYDWIKRKAL